MSDLCQCDTPADQVLTVEIAAGLATICRACAEAVYAAVAAERTCAGCKHFTTNAHGAIFCAHDGAWEQWEEPNDRTAGLYWTVHSTFGCNRWEAREEAPPCNE